MEHEDSSHLTQRRNATPGEVVPSDTIHIRPEWDEKRYQSQNTVQMLDMLISFIILLSFAIALSVMVFLLVMIPRQFLDPLDVDNAELKPEMVALTTMEFVLFVTTCLLVAVRKMPEGKVVVYSITLLMNGVLVGFTLATIFRKLIKGIS